jgi:hypothetical protein
VAFVSDTHLAARAPEADANWAAIVDHVDATRPSLVVHLGDASLDGAHRPADLDHARARLDELDEHGVAWRAIPGNHDIGDNPAGDHVPSTPVDDVRRQRWLDVVGPDRWALDLDGWRLVAVDAQLFGSGLAAEEEQWEWLGAAAADQRDGRAVALLSHKPWSAPTPELAAAPPYRFVPPPSRHRLRQLFGDDPPAIVVSGHVHQHRVLELDGSRHVWAPTSWAVLPDDVQPPVGTKRCGILTATFDADGSGPSVTLVEPDGIRQLMLRRDLPNPYGD